ncbi:hypothetical protein CAEBREN_32756 [Caenorhabditis brenneri]|uniref:Serpentine receptor class gamma n=1 Tax=Caenorhabditis brenneri TaxID=135651 RepID=G0M8Y3_CAEBE|nr:hypothetical protein CAEBREN_32756 [Caenorhabditis brenneri]
MNELEIANSIHGVLEYINFKFHLNFRILITTLPLIYIVPTMIVMWKVFKGYRAEPIKDAKLTLDGNLFLLLMLYFTANIILFFADYLRFNIPVSGLITSWCASISPNKLFIVLIIIRDYVNYCVLILPFLVSLIRIIILTFTYNQRNVRSCAMRWFILPILFLVPLIFISFLFPSIGYCRQLGSPFPFGAVDIYYFRGFIGLSRSYFILALSSFCWTLSAVLSSFMYFKLRTAITNISSPYTRALARRAEISISITLISAVVPFITNTIVSVTTLWTPSIKFYFLPLRIIGNDFETVMMPWILFITHPIFRKMRGNSKTTLKTIRVSRVS